jgi:hypothetical protein
MMLLFGTSFAYTRNNRNIKKRADRVSFLQRSALWLFGLRFGALRVYPILGASEVNIGPS